MIKLPEGTRLTHYTFAYDFDKAVIHGNRGVWNNKECVCTEDIPLNKEYKTMVCLTLDCGLRKGDEYFIWLKYRAGSTGSIRFEAKSSASIIYSLNGYVTKEQVFKEMKIPVSMFTNTVKGTNIFESGDERVTFNFLSIYFLKTEEDDKKGVLYIDDFVIVKK
jgi:hypothetical protein